MPQTPRTPPGGPDRAGGAAGGQQAWPGRRLGLPESGPRSIARLGRRVAAIAIDWALAYIVAFAFFGGEGIAITIVFVLVQIVFLITLGGTIGHLALRMRVVPMAGGYLGLWRPVVRTLLVALVIPAVVFDLDQRGLHDRIAGTVLVRV
ncbi:RDD family protein [Frigoribacterium sp. CFBP9039]|uniref:RDD family protein n=1 Tax=Frigoribacterium TaxID=96492 RepID=UPI00177DE911|nr:MULTISPECIES: RDD family protein [Frigoribacterium]MBD8703369.1 RDD family protein [Frigoribacterium sp. CFBP 13712]MCJ0701515.1 RDD family protein [Frigoribacterium faeni]MDY0892953.1 RDD family protein [Frigoribacterium sp. CFBP9030]MDY0944917.1 RDD family protein [Frigoribacterium sp. CFBP9039]